MKLRISQNKKIVKCLAAVLCLVLLCMTVINPVEIYAAEVTGMVGQDQATERSDTKSDPGAEGDTTGKTQSGTKINPSVEDQLDTDMQPTEENQPDLETESDAELQMGLDGQSDGEKQLGEQVQPEMETQASKNVQPITQSSEELASATAGQQWNFTNKDLTL